MELHVQVADPEFNLESGRGFGSGVIVVEFCVVVFGGLGFWGLVFWGWCLLVCCVFFGVFGLCCFG